MTDPPANDTPNPDDPEGKKRRPKDSEFFELPPDLKKMKSGELPASVGSSSGANKGDTKKSGESPKKGGCAGLLLGLLAAGATAAGLVVLAGF